MPRNCTLLLILIFAAGCVTQPTPTQTETRSAPTEPDDSGETLVPEPLDQAVAVTEPPGRCEQLIESLEKVQLLVEDLDGKLSDNAGRLDAALQRLDEPPPRTSPEACLQDSGREVTDKDVIGGIEWLYMEPPGRHFRARVDSGAETSSLSAKDVVEFERDGDDWVRFTFEHDSSDPVEIELPISRKVLIRQASAEQLDRRVVIEMDIHLGDRLQRTEFTLTDRSRMTYPVLLGRAFLIDLYVVDVARSYIHPRYEAP